MSSTYFISSNFISPTLRIPVRAERAKKADYEEHELKWFFMMLYNTLWFPSADFPAFTFQSFTLKSATEHKVHFTKKNGDFISFQIHHLYIHWILAVCHLVRRQQGWMIRNAITVWKHSRFCYSLDCIAKILTKDQIVN